MGNMKYTEKGRTRTTSFVSLSAVSNQKAIQCKGEYMYYPFHSTMTLIQRSTCTTQVLKFQIDQEAYTYYHPFGTTSQKGEDSLKL